MNRHPFAPDLRTTTSRALRNRRARILAIEPLEARQLLASLSFTTQPQTVGSGLPLGPVSVALPAGGTGLVTLSLGDNPGSMRLGGTTVKAASSGSVTFNDLYVFGGTPAKSYTLLAYAAGLDAAESNAFDVKVGPDHLNIVNLASSALAGTSLAASGGSVSVQVLDANGTTSLDATGTVVTLLLDKNPGGATFLDASGSPIGTTLTAATTNGVATFPNVRLDKAGSGYTLSALATNSPVIHGASSSPFSVVAAAASALAFAQPIPSSAANQPINMIGRVPPYYQAGVLIDAVDRFGNLAHDFSGEVTVAFGANPGGDTLGGQLTVPAVQGVAQFNSLVVKTSGVGYTLTATGVGLAGTATSTPFPVAASAPSRLDLITPSVLTVGINQKLPTLVAQVLDGNGQVMTNDNTTRVTLSPAGVLFGATTVTVKNGVATFDSVSMGQRRLAQPEDKILNVIAQFSELGLGQSNPVTFTLTPGVATSLNFRNTSIIDAVAGDPLTVAGGGPILVDALDISGNVVDLSGLVVSIGVNQAAPNSLPTFLGQGDDPTDPSTLALYQTATTSHGTATFDKLFINRASTDYQLAAGTDAFFNVLAPTTLAFDVSIGAASGVRFVVPPVLTVGSRQRIPGDGGFVSIAVTDRVGNVIVTDSSTTVQVSLTVPSGAPGTPTLKTGDPAGLTKTVQGGIAIFDALYVDQVVPPPPPDPQTITGYTLVATSTGLGNPVASRPFGVDPPPAVAIPDTLSIVTAPPASVGLNSPFTLAYHVENSGQPDLSYAKQATITAYLVDATTGLRTVGFGLIGTSSLQVADASNTVTFADLLVDHPGTYRIRTLTDIGALVSISDAFTVETTARALASPGPQIQTVVPADPQAVAVGLGSYIQDITYYQQLPIVQADKVPDSSAPSDPKDASRLVQPNVTLPIAGHPEYESFDQVPITSKWWSAQMFQRLQAVGIDEKDSQGNRLFPMFSDPFAMMVNSNDGSADDFAGLGLSHLTHLFVNPAAQFLDTPVPGQTLTKPNPLYPGNDKFFYSYNGLLQPDQRLYQDLSFGLQGVKADATVLRYSDWTATLNWSDAQGVPRLQALLGEGLPYAYFTAKNVDPTNGSPMQIVTGNPLWQNFSLEVSSYDPATGILTPVTAGMTGQGAFQVRIRYQVEELTAPGNATHIMLNVDNTYGIFVPTGTTWTVSANAVQFTLTTSANYASVATLPDNTAATFQFYRQHAYSFVTGSAVDFHYDEPTGTVTTTYALQTNQVETGPDIAANRPLQGLYANLYRNLLPNTPLTPVTYATARGTLKVFDGPVYATQLTYRGVVSQAVPVPGANAFQTTLWRTYLYPLLVNISSAGPNNGSFNLLNLLPTFGNDYVEGQAMLSAASLIPILNEVADADPTSNPDLSDSERDLARTTARRIFELVRDRMSAWLSGTDDSAPYMLYYQPKAPFEDPTGQQLGKSGWQFLVPVQSGFLSSESINDQNLIEGYYIKTAAILAQYDRTWGDRSAAINGGASTRAAKYGDLIDLMVKNVANTDRQDTRFPFLRNFDVLQGHSWADGAANDQAGTNQESSSESLNFASGLILWGEATGDMAMRDLGVYLYTTEVESVNTYYFDVNGTDAFPVEFTGGDKSADPVADRPLIPFPHTASGEVGGFVGIVRSNFAGIEMLPLTGGSYYLGQDPKFVDRLFAWASVNTSSIGQVPIKTPSYLSLLYPYLALGGSEDADRAMSLYTSQITTIGAVNPSILIDTHAYNIHWIAGLQAYGQVDSKVTASSATAMAFIDGTTRTFVAYNSGALPKSVAFLDATGATLLTLTVAPRTIVVTDATGKVVTSQTTPDYSLETPADRFFLSGKNGPTLIRGQAGAGGDATLDIPGDGSPLSFTLTGVYGTIKPGAVLEDYAVYVDPTFRPEKPAPSVQVTFSYQNAGDAKATVFTFIQNTLSTLPGFVRADSNTGLGGVIPFHLPTLTNATVIVSLQQINAGSDAPPLRLKVDAAAEQGRTSYFSLPYNISKTSADTPAPPSFAVRSSPSPSQAMTAPATLGHTYTAMLNASGTLATFFGNDSSDTLVFGASGGFLMHNRFTAGDPGFASDLDFDSTQAGVQTLAANATSQVAVLTGSGVDTVVIGTSASPASSLRAGFSITNQDDQPDTIAIHDDTNASALAYTIDADSIEVANDRLRVQHTGAFSSIALTTGSGLNTTRVIGVASKDSVILDTRRGIDVVTIGDGSVQGILGSVEVRNATAFTHLVVDNSQAKDFSSSVSISETGITGLAPGAIRYLRADIDDLEILGGTNDGVYRLSTSLDGSYLHLHTGSGVDQVILGNASKIDTASFPGLVLLQGNGQSILLADNLAGGPKTITTNLTGLSGLVDDGLEVRGFGGMTVALGAGDDQVTVFDTIATMAYNFETGAGRDTVRVNVLNSPLRVDGGADADSIVSVLDPILIEAAVTLLGGAGDDTIQGGPRNDLLSGGPGNDVVNGGPGDDLITWNAGDGSDRIDGGTGADTASVIGSDTLSNSVVVSRDGARARVSIANAATAVLDLGTIETLNIATGGGDDGFDITPLATTAVNVDAGASTNNGDRIIVRDGSTVSPKFEYLGPGSGVWTSTDASAVRFVGVETFNAPENVLYVLGLYRTVLERTPAAVELNPLVTVLDAGASRLDLAQGFWRSPEHRASQVEDYYETILGRSGSAEEIRSYVAAFQSGADETAIRARFLSSEEYVSAHPTPRALVQGLYRDVLGRAATRRELVVWTRAARAARGPLALSRKFLLAPAASKRTVNSTYQVILGRPADSRNLANLAIRLSRRQDTPSTLAERLLASREFPATPR